MDAKIKVVEYKTEKPIPYATVIITRGKPSSGIGTQQVTTLTTNENGEVLYNEKIDKEYFYYAQAKVDKYIDNNAQNVLVPGERCQDVTLELYAESYVKLHVKNVNPFNMYDVIKFGIGCTAVSLQGSSIDSTFLFCDYGFAFMGNFELYNYACISTKNNIDSAIYFSFLPKPHDTITVSINY
nr:hypothetical protein [Bacteroidota bacterium]